MHKPDITRIILDYPDEALNEPYFYTTASIAHVLDIIQTQLQQNNNSIHTFSKAYLIALDEKYPPNTDTSIQQPIIDALQNVTDAYAQHPNTPQQDDARAAYEQAQALTNKWCTPHQNEHILTPQDIKSATTDTFHEWFTDDVLCTQPHAVTQQVLTHYIQHHPANQAMIQVMPENIRGLYERLLLWYATPTQMHNMNYPETHYEEASLPYAFVSYKMETYKEGKPSPYTPFTSLTYHELIHDVTMHLLTQNHAPIHYHVDKWLHNIHEHLEDTQWHTQQNKATYRMLNKMKKEVTNELHRMHINALHDGLNNVHYHNQPLMHCMEDYLREQLQQPYQQPNTKALGHPFTHTCTPETVAFGNEMKPTQKQTYYQQCTQPQTLTQAHVEHIVKQWLDMQQEQHTTRYQNLVNALGNTTHDYQNTYTYKPLAYDVIATQFQNGYLSKNVDMDTLYKACVLTKHIRYTHEQIIVLIKHLLSNPINLPIHNQQLQEDDIFQLFHYHQHNMKRVRIYLHLYLDVPLDASIAELYALIQQHPTCGYQLHRY